ncbi:ABC transporter substrate-binding protein [Candidatus Infernicultor aquiphilus]
MKKVKKEELVMKQARKVALVLTLVLLSSLFLFNATIFAASETLKIGVAIPSADHGWTGGIVWWAKKAISDWQEKDKNIEFYLVTAESASQQVGQVEDLMVKGINALVILAYDSAPLTPVVEEVKKKGIYIVSVDRGLLKPVEDVYIAGDNPGYGRAPAEYTAKELKGKGKIVILEGIPCVINTERVEAYNAVMKNYPDIEILDSQPANWSTQKGLEIMENYLQKYKQIDAVWAGDDDCLKGALQAYKESGRKDIKIFFGGGGAKDIVKMIMDGDPLVRATPTYSPSMIASGISLAVMGLKHESLTGFYQRQIPSKIILATEMIIKENAEYYYEPDNIY